MSNLTVVLQSSFKVVEHRLDCMGGYVTQETTVGYHSGVPQWGTTVGYHSGVPQWGTTVGYHSGVPQ